MGTIRVLVVEDSLTVRRSICDALASDPELEIVGEAADGKRAIELCSELRPDVITLDMMLPVMTGLAATEYIMAHWPTPILIVSSSLNRGELFRTYDALAAGAVDVLEKPRGDEPEGSWEEQLLARVKLVARIKVITHPRARLGRLGQPASAASPVVAARAPSRGPEAFARAAGPYRAVAIGASTGGPAAVVGILTSLPAPPPWPILLVLHIGAPFAASLAEWLDAQSSLSVRGARPGESLAAAAGSVLMAPPDRHLVVRNGRIDLSDEPPRHCCRPSVDLLFESVAQELGSRAIGCLLTGMGRDGAAGLLALRRAGALTIAQDEASSVVYGMPREAAVLDAARFVLPLSEIGETLGRLAADRARGAPP